MFIITLLFIVGSLFLFRASYGHDHYNFFILTGSAIFLYASIRLAQLVGVFPL